MNEKNLTLTMRLSVWATTNKRKNQIWRWKLALLDRFVNLFIEVNTSDAHGRITSGQKFILRVLKQDTEERSNIVMEIFIGNGDRFVSRAVVIF